MEDKEILKPVLELRDILFRMSIIGFVVGVIVVIFYARRLTNAFRTVISGDLTQNIDQKLLSRTDEIGEMGKGFAVVAEEVRKLAEQARSSAQLITERIQQVAEESALMLKSSQQMKCSMAEQDADMATSAQSFKQIMDAIVYTTPRIDMLQSSARTIMVLNDEMVSKLEDSSAIAEQISASSQEIAATSEEAAVSSREVVSTSGTLTEMTKILSEEMKNFKV